MAAAAGIWQDVRWIWETSVVAEKLEVKEAAGLLAFLRGHLPGWSGATVKQRLRAGCVRVNGRAVTRHDHALAPGDTVEITAVRDAPRPPAELDILFADRDLVAIAKPAGLLSVGTAQERRVHALALLRRQLARRAPAVRLWPVHRIDQGTSGVLLFATSHGMREAVMERWDEAEKTYLAVVAGRPDPPRGTIDQPLRPDKEIYRMHVGAHPDARPAVTHYRTERAAPGRSLLRVWLETGRQHQIRAHLAWLGCPVVGDPRYGTAGPRLGLHALRLQISHPRTGEILLFEALPPDDFLALIEPPPGKKP